MPGKTFAFIWVIGLVGDWEIR